MDLIVANNMSHTMTVWMLRVGSVFVFSLEELVKPEKNGLIFRDSEELAQQLQVRRIVNKITDFFLEKIYF